MKLLPKGFCAVVVPIAILLSVPLLAADVSLIGPPDRPAPSHSPTVTLSPGSSDATYTGKVRLYLVEPVGRWIDEEDHIYYQGFLDFPLTANLNLTDGETLYQNATWDASAHPSIGFLVETNIEVIAVVTMSTPVETDAYPPNGYWFNAYYVDACASARPGTPGTNVPTIAGYTHNVFIEEGTRTT